MDCVLSFLYISTRVELSIITLSIQLLTKKRENSLSIPRSRLFLLKSQNVQMNSRIKVYLNSSRIKFLPIITYKFYRFEESTLYHQEYILIYLLSWHGFQVFKKIK